MAHPDANQSLAAALAAAQGSMPASRQGHDNPLVDRLATALAVPAPEIGDDEDSDEDLDLPMLVQGNRAIVPAVPRQRGREGRAALIGFGLGLILLVPIGVVMSNRLPEPVPRKGEAIAPPLAQAFVPSSTTIEEPGIKTTRRATQPIPVAAAPIEMLPLPAAAPMLPPPLGASETAPPAPAVVAAVPAAILTITAPEPVPVVPITPAIKPAAPDHLGKAGELIAKGDILAARAMIDAANPDANPMALLALAETFDPNMLAAWSIRGAYADVDRARQLYRRALGDGMTKAQQRLDALE